MLHFVTSYTKQNKSHKQTLESAQYGLEISFKAFLSTAARTGQFKIWLSLAVGIKIVEIFCTNDKETIIFQRI